jgi:hypothetical protein
MTLVAPTGDPRPCGGREAERREEGLREERAERVNGELDAEALFCRFIVVFGRTMTPALWKITSRRVAWAMKV